MAERPCFTPRQLAVTSRASRLASDMVTAYYRIAPREWAQMPYEVRTLRRLEQSEVVDDALAQTVCYSFKREAGPVVLREGEIYRICLQDHRILDAAAQTSARLQTLLLYVLTHELVHVVRFGQRLQQMDLPNDLRPFEEQCVEKTTSRILARFKLPGVDASFIPQSSEPQLV
ncbi:MAG TPA: hypothetical protein VJX67_02535 [Blastocatellia bacterium]|nr:hypothetical protein [Blastocatellia bacterium]